MRTLEQQIRSTDFALSRKGYDPSSVDEALAGFADDVAILLAELRKESIRVSTLERSLTFAQNSGSSSQPDFASLMIEATEKRDQLLAEAQVSAAEIIANANRQSTVQTESSRGALSQEDAQQRDEHIELALEEAAAIESAARELAEGIRSKAESDADQLLESARTTAKRSEVVNTGTDIGGVEMAQQYG